MSTGPAIVSKPDAIHALLADACSAPLPILGTPHAATGLQAAEETTTTTTPDPVGRSTRTVPLEASGDARAFARPRGGG